MKKTLGFILIILLLFIQLLPPTLAAEASLEIGDIKGKNRLRYMTVGPVLTYEIINNDDRPVQNINYTLQVNHFILGPLHPQNLTLDVIPAQSSVTEMIQFCHWWGPFDFTLILLPDTSLSISKTAHGFILGRFFIHVRHT